MYGIASTTATLATAFSGVGTILALSIGTIVTGLIALLGLGFGIRKLTEHITGPSFNRAEHNARNRKYAAQLMNEEMLGEGNRVGTLSSKFERGF